ncbi:MAG TPA: CBS domain-containing protein [Actinomycetota bacterium]|nr:CBS domain-containing protein [Actinomycetota bacterium]
MSTLRDVMNEDLTTVAPGATVAEAAQLMSVRHVGSALVMERGQLVGIFTERDIVRALASDFDAAGHTVDGTMSRDPRTMPADATTKEALDVMLAGGFRHLPVTDGQDVVGVVSLRDLAPR